MGGKRSFLPGEILQGFPTRGKIFPTDNYASDGVMNCKKSAEVIVVQKDEGPNNSNLGNRGGVSDATITDNIKR
jgi:hypothetical protein